VNKSLLKLLKISFPILLGVFLIWYSLSKVSIEELVEHFKAANYFYIFLGVFLGLLSHLSRAYRWLFQLEPLGYKVRFGNSIMAVFATYLINYTVPRAGEFARASILANYESVPFEKGFGTIVAERVADVIVMLLIMVITLFLEFDFIFNFFTERFNAFKIIVGFLLLLALGMFFVFYIKKSTSKIALKIKTLVNGLIEGVFSIFKMKKKWPFIFHTLFIWGMYVLMFYVTSFAITGLQPIPFGAILIGFIAASFSIAATNGGIGSYPVAVFGAFAIFSIPEDPSIAFGWIMWTSQTAMIILLGGLSLLILPIYNRKK